MEAPAIPTAASPYLCALAFLADAARRRRAAGALALISGLGYFGGLWERHANMDLRRVLGVRLSDIDGQQVVIHLALVAYGLRRLAR